MSAAQHQAEIEQLLHNYTHSVSTGNRALFESQLLDRNIPFFGVRGKLDDAFDPDSKGVQNYAAFQVSVFDSGVKFAQKFSNVKIESAGDLAQVSLDFETVRVESGEGGRGWKVLQLLRIQGRWKIVSELFTVNPLVK